MTDALPLDPVIHAEARLRVMTTLAALGPKDEMSFPRLQELLGMTAGNLSTHNRKLEEAGYITVTKTIEGRSPATYLALTDTGRAAFGTYRKALAALLGG
ncbi:MAG: transcriptional regulator [Tetrasphaera sp.]|nr:transcriptional regulator [Tetrasphaera sp.]